ncbi:MAG: hypothetical protein JWR24_886 [Actinoallomurus sp.]|jgi:hypothetical protein|nr:hypothetical protein [Actinoallomurus sp.]
MGDKSDKHGPRLDDEMRHETEGLVRGGGPTHAEEWKETEPVQTDAGRDPTSVRNARSEGTPPGMTPRDVENRSALAQVLAGARFPATPEVLAEHAAGQGAPDAVVTALRELPERTYANVADVSDALGYGHETRRF